MTSILPTNNLHILKIVLKDSTDNEINKKLFEFLNNNYKEIIDCDYYIQPILVTPNNIDYFVKKNIDSTPGLLDEVNNKSITGLHDIIKYIVKMCESNNSDILDNDSNNNVETKSNFNNNNDLRDYLINEAFQDPVIEDPIDLDIVKEKSDQFKLRQEQKTNIKYPNRIIETVKKNLNSDNNKSIENYNNYKDEYTNLNDEITKTRPISEYMDDDKDLKNFWENFEEST